MITLIRYWFPIRPTQRQKHSSKLCSHNSLPFFHSVLPSSESDSHEGVVLFNNHVFVKVVRIRRGETAQIFTTIRDMGSLYAHFNYFTRIIGTKIDPRDPNAEHARAIVKNFFFFLLLSSCDGSYFVNGLHTRIVHGVCNHSLVGV